MKRKILIVDDELHIVEFLEMNLRQNGYETIHAYDGTSAINLARTGKADLILLDLMLPKINGIETCRRLKQDLATTHIPIIMLTAKSEESDKVIGLGIGADDYVTKPFGLRELFARIEVVLRRCNTEYQQNTPLHIQNLCIDSSRYSVEKDGARIELTRTEFALLSILARNVNKVVARSELITSLDVSNASPEARSLDVHVRNLRKKLQDDLQQKRYIETVRGIGFKLNG